MADDKNIDNVEIGELYGVKFVINKISGREYCGYCGIEMRKVEYPEKHFMFHESEKKL
jgi:hypothetical protein